MLEGLPIYDICRVVSLYDVYVSRPGGREAMSTESSANFYCCTRLPSTPVYTVQHTQGRVPEDVFFRSRLTSLCDLCFGLLRVRRRWGWTDSTNLASPRNWWLQPRPRSWRRPFSSCLRTLSFSRCDRGSARVTLYRSPLFCRSTRRCFQKKTFYEIWG